MVREPMWWVFLTLLTPWNVNKHLPPHLRLPYSFAWVVSPQPWHRWFWLPHRYQRGFRQGCFQALLCWKSFWANVLFFKWWGIREEEIIHKLIKMEVVTMNVSAWTALWPCQVAEECSCFVFSCIPSEANKTNRNVNSISFCKAFMSLFQSDLPKKEINFKCKGSNYFKHFQ